eukprot:31398-Pelagococcus_subviridis.AAC.9
MNTRLRRLLRRHGRTSCPYELYSLARSRPPPSGWLRFLSRVDEIPHELLLRDDLPGVLLELRERFRHRRARALRVFALGGDRASFQQFRNAVVVPERGHERSNFNPAAVVHVHDVVHLPQVLLLHQIRPRREQALRVQQRVREEPRHGIFRLGELLRHLVPGFLQPARDDRRAVHDAVHDDVRALPDAVHDDVRALPDAVHDDVRAADDAVHE